MSARALRLSLAASAVWGFAYFAWPCWSFDDGPFFAEPFRESVGGLPVLSSTKLCFWETTVFVLETRLAHDGSGKTRTVFVLKDGGGQVRWAEAASADFERIRLVDQRGQWFPPGGWRVAIWPEGTESGELYLSPFGAFRFFFHSW